MKLTIEEDCARLTIEAEGESRSMSLFSDEAFELISRQYVRVGWNQKQAYTYSWLGRPIIQFPDDLIRVQELIYRLRPDLIVETGIAHGGSLVFYAGLLEAMGRGRVLGVDIEIRAHNRQAIEAHELSHRIGMIEGSSVDPGVVAQVVAACEGLETVLVILDSNHSYDHVLGELSSYAPIVTRNSYIVVCDGVMRDLADVPRAGTNWETNNPANAAEDFAASNPEFAIERPDWTFNESTLTTPVTHHPSAWLRRL